MVTIAASVFASEVQENWEGVQSLILRQHSRIPFTTVSRRDWKLIRESLPHFENEFTCNEYGNDSSIPHLLIKFLKYLLKNTSALEKPSLRFKKKVNKLCLRD